MFKVGDRIEAIDGSKDYYPAGATGTVVCVDGSSYKVSFDPRPEVNSYCPNWWIAHVNTKAATNPTEIRKADHVIPISRSNDPATSKGARRVNKYEEEVLAQLSLIGPSTGKEIAALGQLPLNSITPRFAPLRRKGLIKDSGLRRDKQIVWVLA